MHNTTVLHQPVFAGFSSCFVHVSLCWEEIQPIDYYFIYSRGSSVYPAYFNRQPQTRTQSRCPDTNTVEAYRAGLGSTHSSRVALSTSLLQLTISGSSNERSWQQCNRCWDCLFSQPISRQLLPFHLYSISKPEPDGRISLLCFEYWVILLLLRGSDNKTQIYSQWGIMDQVL